MAKFIKQKAIICDIDGVLLDTEHIFDKIKELNLTGYETGMRTITTFLLTRASLKCWKHYRRITKLYF